MFNTVTDVRGSITLGHGYMTEVEEDKLIHNMNKAFNEALKTVANSLGCNLETYNFQIIQRNSYER